MSEPTDPDAWAELARRCRYHPAARDLLRHLDKLEAGTGSQSLALMVHVVKGKPLRSEALEGRTRRVWIADR